MNCHNWCVRSNYSLKKFVFKYSIQLNRCKIDITIMDSIGKDCNELKQNYDTCFNSWFSEKFLKGHTNDDACAPLFKIYQSCVKQAMKDQQIEFKDIDADHLGSEQECRKPPNKAS